MNINSCSKAELIYIIKNYKCDPERVEALLFAYRSKELIAQSQSAFDAAMKALTEYIGDIPDITLTKAAELSGAYEKHMRTYNRLQKKLNAVMKEGYEK